MSLQGSLSIEHMCQMVSVSRRSFYRSLQEQAAISHDFVARLQSRRDLCFPALAFAERYHSPGELVVAAL